MTEPEIITIYPDQADAVRAHPLFIPIEKYGAVKPLPGEIGAIVNGYHAKAHKIQSHGWGARYVMTIEYGEFLERVIVGSTP